MLLLLDGQGVEIARNDDYNASVHYCSMIDGNTSAAAQDLAGGRYYLQVHSYQNRAPVSAYVLIVGLQP